MRWLLVFVFLLGIAYAWFSTYDPKPSASTMQGVIQRFQEAVIAKDLSAMQSCCTGRAMEACALLLEEIRSHEGRRSAELVSVGSIGFDYTRGRTVVDGMINGVDSDGDMVFSRTVRVEQNESGDFWSITNL